MRVSKVFLVIIIMSLLALLPSSSFFLSNYLTKQIKDDTYRQGQFSYALKNYNVAALIVQESKAAYGSADWLSLNRKLAVTEGYAALKLGIWYQTQAKNKGESSKNSTAVLWFEQAIRFKSQAAILALAQLYYEQGAMVQAKTTLHALSSNIPLIEQDLAVLMLRIKISVHLGDIEVVKQQVQLLQDSDLYKTNIGFSAKKLVAEMYSFAILSDGDGDEIKVDINIDNQSSIQQANSLDCITSLQLFATNLKHLNHLQRLIKKFKAQQPLAQNVCLPTPKYISLALLDCEAHENEAISCDESHWKVIASKVSSRHIGLLLEEGGANVHLGMLYFDSKDSVSVFSHEVSHLLGFVDEYPLVKTHEKCQSSQEMPFAHNIAVLTKSYSGSRQRVRAKVLDNLSWGHLIKGTTPILQPSQRYPKNKILWQLGTPEGFESDVGLYAAESCQDSAKDQGENGEVGFSAFKPIDKRTQLRNLSSEFPTQYLALLKAKPNAYLMPSFHYNIALALYQQGKVTQAIHWLNKSAQWEDDLVKKKKILQGDF